MLQNQSTRSVTRRAVKDAVSLGYCDVDEMVDRVCKLNRKEFCKTMTRDSDHTLWQDVYKTEDEDCNIYIKLQKSHDGKGVIISFHNCD